MQVFFFYLKNYLKYLYNVLISLTVAPSAGQPRSTHNRWKVRPSSSQRWLVQTAVPRVHLSNSISSSRRMVSQQRKSASWIRAKLVSKFLVFVCRYFIHCLVELVSRNQNDAGFERRQIFHIQQHNQTSK